MDNYVITKIQNNFWVIQDHIVNMFLFSGTPYPILIDTGFGKGKICNVCKELTGMEPLVILSHSHNDHTGGISQFKNVLAHAATIKEIQDDLNGLKKVSIIPWAEGADVSNSDFHFHLIHVPGHTMGSLAVLDQENRRIFIGDMISHPPVHMCLPGADMQLYEQSLTKLYGIRHLFDTIFVNHGENPAPLSMLNDYLVLSQQICTNTANGKPDIYFDRYPCMRYEYRSASIFI